MSFLRPVMSVGKSVVGVTDDIVTKVLRSRTTLQASDLSGQTFNSVLDACKREGLTSVKLVPTRSGGHIVNISDIDRTGLIKLFPGGVMAPNKPLTVSLKFNSAGDCLQITGLQKHANAVSGSTIRTTEGINALRKAGVENPTEYVQVYADKYNRWTNKTYSPFGDLPKPVTSATETNVVASAIADSKPVVQEVVESAEEILEKQFAKTLEQVRKISPQEASKIEATMTRRNPHSIPTYKQSIIDSYGNLSDDVLKSKIAEEQAAALVRAQERAYNRLYDLENNVIARNLEPINPELSKKVIAKLEKIADTDPIRAKKLAEDLIDRYSGNLDQLASKSKSSRLFDSFDDDFQDMMRRQDDEYYDRLRGSIDDFFSSSSNPFDSFSS